MAKVQGVGGVFFKAKDPKMIAQWYQTWLGFEIDASFNGASFQAASMPETGCTVWSPFAADTEYFQPSNQAYMINLIVDDLEGALAQVEQGGATLVGQPEDFDYGKFGWFLDPEGNKVELWQPK
jgi:predicted enzyme related to lactoylglutathione lyase